MIEIACAACSETGHRSRNEDAACSFQSGGRWLAVVADGAGGHRDGAEASRRVVAAMDEWLDGGDAQDFCPERMGAAVLAAHDKVCAGQGDAAGAQRMLSTVVALWIDAGSGAALWSHVGDSRLYRVRQGRVQQLTRDDSVVQRMLDAGLLTLEQASRHPHRNQLMAALGMDEDEVDPHTPPFPEPLREGDAYLLCTDGWWGSLGDDGIPGALAGAATPEDWIAAMQQRIAAMGKDDQDNYSAVAVWIGDVHGGTRPMPL